MSSYMLILIFPSLLKNHSKSKWESVRRRRRVENVLRIVACLLLQEGNTLDILPEAAGHPSGILSLPALALTLSSDL